MEQIGADANFSGKGNQMLLGTHAPKLDDKGRVTIPPTLRSYAGLGKELVVIGVGSRAEIWDSAAWSDYLAKQENGFSEISEEVVPGLF